MASHWTKFVSGVSEKQGYALDRMADEHGFADGAQLLADAAGCSRSKLGKLRDIRGAIDAAFAKYSRTATV